MKTQTGLTGYRIATDDTRLCFCVYVGLRMIITTVRFAKTAEPVEMPFGMLTHVVPRNQDTVI